MIDHPSLVDESLNMMKKPALKFFRRCEELQNDKFSSAAKFAKAFGLSDRQIRRRCDMLRKIGIEIIDVKKNEYTCVNELGLQQALRIMNNPKLCRLLCAIFQPHNKLEQAKNCIRRKRYQKASEILYDAEVKLKTRPSGRNRPPLNKPLLSSVKELIYILDQIIFTTTEASSTLAKKIEEQEVNQAVYQEAISDSQRKRIGREKVSVRAPIPPVLDKAKNWRQRKLVSAHFLDASFALHTMNQARRAIDPSAHCLPPKHEYLAEFAKIFDMGYTPEHMKIAIHRKKIDAQKEKSKVKYLNSWVLCNPRYLQNVLSFVKRLPNEVTMPRKDDYADRIVRLGPMEKESPYAAHQAWREAKKREYEAKRKQYQQPHAANSFNAERPRHPERVRNYRTLEEVSQEEYQIGLDALQQIKTMLGIDKKYD